MISISMATYNGEKFIAKQIDSILQQTFQDYELVITDDCSKDNTLRILHEYEKKDKRIHVYENETNLGFKKNFERSISLCKGDYVVLADQDDIWEKNHIELLLNNIGDASAVIGDASIIDENDKITSQLSLSQFEKITYIPPLPEMFYGIMFFRSPFPGSTSMFKMSLLKKALPIPDKVVYHDAWFCACAACDNGIKCIDNIITRHRFTGKNASGDHKWILKDKIKNNLKRDTFDTDRLVYSEELRNRFPEMSLTNQKILRLSDTFFKNRIDDRHRLKSAFIIIRYFRNIYFTKSYKYLLPRVIGILIRG